MYFNGINAPLWLPVVYCTNLKFGERLQHTGTEMIVLRPLKTGPVHL